jgi:hypothetical protein
MGGMLPTCCGYADDIGDGAYADGLMFVGVTPVPADAAMALAMYWYIR